MEKIKNNHQVIENSELRLLVACYGWSVLDGTESAKEILKDAPAYTFILGLSHTGFEDILLFYVDCNGAFRIKPIHLIQKPPSVKIMNGTNRIYPDIRNLILDMMECSLDQLNPIFEKRNLPKSRRNMCKRTL